MKLKTHKGATLLEVMIGTFIFSILAVVTYVVFQMGELNYQTGVMKNSLLTETQRSVSVLEKDLQMTDFSSVSYLDSAGNGFPVSAGGVSLDRCALSFAGLDDWGNSNNFSGVTLRPDWDEYIVYLATTEQGVFHGIAGTSAPTSGRFYRIAILHPSGLPNFNPPQFQGLYDLAVQDIWPQSNQDYSTVLSEASNFGTAQVNYLGPVNVFSINLPVNEEIVEVTYRNEQKGINSQSLGQRAANNNQGLQLDLDIHPENNF
jgi:hypothetical protein